MPAFACNWLLGWSLVLIGLLSGSVLGQFFHREDFLGGYTSFQRRLFRLGHIAFVALGMMNVLFSISMPVAVTGYCPALASAGFMVGGLTMPLMCFLTGWRQQFRHGFAVPVIALLVAVAATIYGGLPCVSAFWP